LTTGRLLANWRDEIDSAALYRAGGVDSGNTPCPTAWRAVAMLALTDKPPSSSAALGFSRQVV
jgi:hypothetical protein